MAILRLWPAIGKGRLPGFLNLFDEYPDLSDTVRFLYAKLQLSCHISNESDVFLAFICIINFSCYFSLNPKEHADACDNADNHVYPYCF